VDRIIEIVNYLIKQTIQINNDNARSEESMVEQLLLLGYHPAEIKQALQMLTMIPDDLRNNIEDSTSFREPAGYRIFSEKERRRLSLPSQGRLIRLVNEGLLTAAELEAVLAEVSRIGDVELGLPELEILLQQVVGDEERLLLMLPHVFETGAAVFLN
jgi:uncharacterized protein Smg (DUF494 family)